MSPSADAAFKPDVTLIGSAHEHARGGAFGVSAAWRRGIMHAVERLDLIVGPSKRISKGRAAATIAEVRRVLDDLTKLQRAHTPQTYQAAFDLCSADYANARAKADGALEAPRTDASQVPGIIDK